MKKKKKKLLMTKEEKKIEREMALQIDKQGPTDRTTEKVRAFLNKFTLNDLAQELGVDRTTVLRWRKGRTAPTPKMAFKIMQLSKGELDIMDFIVNYDS